MFNPLIHKDLKIAIEKHGSEFLRLLALFPDRKEFLITQVGLGVLCTYLVKNTLFPPEVKDLSNLSLVLFGIFPKKRSVLKNYDMELKYDQVKILFNIKDEYINVYGMTIVKLSDSKAFKKQTIDVEKNYDLISTEIGYYSSRDSSGIHWFYPKSDKDFSVSPFGYNVRLPRVQYCMLISEAKALKKFSKNKKEDKEIYLYVNSTVKLVLRKPPTVASNMLRNFIYDIHHHRYEIVDGTNNILYRFGECLLRSIVDAGEVGVETIVNLIIQYLLVHYAGVGYVCKYCNCKASPASLVSLQRKQANVSLLHVVSPSALEFAKASYEQEMKNEKAERDEADEDEDDETEEKVVVHIEESASTKYAPQQYMSMRDITNTPTAEDESLITADDDKVEFSVSKIVLS
jgi:VP5 protein